MPKTASTQTTPSDNDQTWSPKDGTPIPLERVTERMVQLIRKGANSSWIPQTVWPSKRTGKFYQGSICLLTSSCALADTRPEDAAPGSDPLFTVLPDRYLNAQEAAVAYARQYAEQQGATPGEAGDFARWWASRSHSVVDDSDWQQWRQ